MDLGLGRQIGYHSARRLLALTGLVVLGATAAVLYVRRVEDIEVFAVLLFIPIFLALIIAKVLGGIIAAVVASATYALLRFVGVDAFDRSEQLQLVLARSAAYLVFGIVGGVAVKQLGNALTRLDRFHVVDDETGLFNARFAANELESELARGTRYGSIFSVAVFTGSTSPLRSLRRGRRDEALSQLGVAVSESVRLMDRAAIAQHGDRYQIMVLMPETEQVGARVLGDRLDEELTRVLGAFGIETTAELSSRVFTFPADRDAIDALRLQFREIDRAEHPTSPGEMAPVS